MMFSIRLKLILLDVVAELWLEFKTVTDRHKRHKNKHELLAQTVTAFNICTFMSG